MSTTQLVREAPIDGGGGSGGAAAPALRRWIGLTAAPTFAIMAAWTALFSAQPALFCMAVRGTSVMSGMTLMYLLMSVFHSSPWLKLIAGRSHGASGQARARAQIQDHSMRCEELHGVR